MISLLIRFSSKENGMGEAIMDVYMIDRLIVDQLITVIIPLFDLLEKSGTLSRRS